MRTWREDLGSFAFTAAVTVLLGAPVGLLWSAVAPHAHVAVEAGGAFISDVQTGVFIAGDGWFIGITLLAGVVTGVLAWLVARGSGPFVVVALALGGLVAAYVASRVGVRIGQDALRRSVRAGRLGNYVGNIALQTKTAWSGGPSARWRRSPGWSPAGSTSSARHVSRDRSPFSIAGSSDSLTPVPHLWVTQRHEEVRMARTPDSWPARPVLGAIVRCAVIVVPVAIAVAVAIVLTRTLPAAATWPGRVAWWVAVLGGSTVALLIADRGARRLLPLAVLLELALVFPGRAPSRLRAARTTSVRELESRLVVLRAQGATGRPIDAAETLSRWSASSACMTDVPEVTASAFARSPTCSRTSSGWTRTRACESGGRRSSTTSASCPSLLRCSTVAPTSRPTNGRRCGGTPRRGAGWRPV